MAKKAPEWLSADIQELYPTCQGNIRAIQRAILAKRGVEPKYMTISNRMDQLGLKRPGKQSKQTAAEDTMIDAPVEVLPNQMDLDANTPVAEVHYGAVNEFDALPAGYAKVIQPMRPYTDAEEWVLNRSMELYGFIGTIVRDQFGRILDGHHRERVARQRGLGTPFTIRQIRDDEDAMEIARSLNTARRHYTIEERQTLAREMRDHGYVYQAIAEALGVGKATVYRDIMGVLRVRAEEIVPHETIPPVNHDDIVPHETIEPHTHGEIVPHETIPDVDQEPPQPVKRVRRKGGGTYPAQRPTGTAQRPTTSPADRQLAQVINLLMSHAQQWNDQHWQAFLEVVQNLRGGRATPATE